MLTVIFWKKVWSWIKHHWYFPVIILLALVFMFLKGGASKRLFKLMEERRALYEKEVDLLKSVAEEKKNKTNDVIEEHQEILKNIELEHEIKIKDLETSKKEELDSLLKDNSDKPEELAKKIAQILGAKHVETK